MTDAVILPFRPLLSRRAVLGTGLTAVTLTAVTRVGSALAQRGGGNVSVDELLKPGDLPDIVIGKADAPIAIVEYASMTCPHCAAFHNTVLPPLKTKYIDTGKARLIFREYPLDDRAMAASMLARCVGGEGPAGFIGELFKRQESWAFAPGNLVVAKLFETAKQAGFTQASFDKCLTDQKLLDQISAIRKRASEKFTISSTPTFFINGTRLGGVSMADFEKVIEPLLPKS